MFNKIKYTLPLLLILIFSALSVSLPAGAQFNAFKDPSVKQEKAKVSDTDLVAVERDIKGGQVVVGETAHYVVIFKNLRATPVKVTNIQLYPSSTVTSKITLNQCSVIPLSQDSQCAVTVAVTGRQGGAFRVEMLVEHDGQSRITTATISGNVESIEEQAEKADGAELALSPTELDFGNFSGGVPLSRSISLKNNSADDIAIKNIGLNVSEKSGFSFKSLCPQVLRKEATCNIILTWAPILKGKAHGVLTIDHTGKAGSSFVEFKGGYSPKEQKFEDIVEGNIEFSTNELDFGTSDGSISRTKSVTLSNKSLSNVDITDVSIEADDNAGFDYISKCPKTLKPSGNCVLVISWKPTKAGLAQGVLTLNHTGKTSMANFEIKGEYIPPAVADQVKDVAAGIKISTDEVDFGTATDNIEKIIPITVTNKTLSAVNLYDMAVNASAQSGLDYDTECFSSLKPGESCSVMLKWKPITKGLSQGAFVLFHSGANGSETVKVKGRYDPAVVSDDESGQVAISPEALDFGTASGGLEMSRSVTLYNRTADSIDITGITIDASRKSGFNYKSHCPRRLSAGGECLIVVSWMPSSPGLAQGVLSVNHTGIETMANLELTAQYEVTEAEQEAGRITASPEALDFGSVSESVSMSRSVTISNRTTEDINIGNIAIDSSDNIGLSHKSKCPKTLKSGSSCVVVVNWKPSLPGSANGVLVLEHDGDESMVIVEVKGTYNYQAEDNEEEGKVSISPDALDFGTSDTNVLMSRSIILSNKTAVDVNIGKIDIDASAKSGFSQKSKCPALLKSGAECVIVVNWKPSAKGAVQGVLTVNHSGDETMSSLELTADYNPSDGAAEGDVVISPEALDFGSSVTDTLMSRSVVLSNNTEKDVIVTDITIDASKKSGFSYKSKCPALLKSGANCVIVVNWKAETAGAVQGVLTVTHSGEETMSNLELSASYDPVEGAEAGDVTISPEELDFGTSDKSFLRSRSVILSNNTEDDIKVGDITIDASSKAGFAYKSKCPALLKSGANCVVVVSWKPDAAGTAQGVLTINHTGDETISTLELNAEYTPIEEEVEEEGEVTISPDALDFGTSDTSVLMSRSVILSNATYEDIEIGDITIDASKKSGFSYKSKCPTVLKAGAECVVVVSWKAQAVGSAQGVLVVNHTGESTMSTLELTAEYAPSAEEEEGDVVISPEALDFGSSDTSTLMSRSVILSNNTDEDIKVEDIAIDGSKRAGFSYKSKCPALLKADANCVIVVSWKPSTEGAVQGVLTVNHSGEDTMSTLEMTAEYNPPEGEEAGDVRISPDALDFGTSDTSFLMSRSVILSNNTDSEIEVGDIVIDASNRSGFSYKSKCSDTLKAGAECIIVVNWKPTTEGTAQGVLTVNHSGENTISTLELTAAYTPEEEEVEEEGEVTISPDALDFGTSDTSVLMSRSVILKNDTYKDIEVGKVTIDASKKSGFTYDSKCSSTLKAGASCVIVVNWKAYAVGSAQGVLIVNHTGEETMSTLELTAEYAPSEGEEEGDVTISPDALDFGTSDTDTLMSRSVVLTNNTDADIKVADIIIDGSKKSGFTYDSKCGSTLKADANCVIVVSWKPSIEGAVQGVLTVNHSGKGAMSNLELTAAYTPVEEVEEEGEVTISPEALDFGTSDTSFLMSRSVILSNDTENDIAVEDIVIDASKKAGFSYKSKCPAILKAGANCIVVVSWKPETEGVAQGVLTVSHTGEDTISTLELTATYTPPEGEEAGDVRISPEALDFGTSETSFLMSRSVILTNSTDEAIAVEDITIDSSRKAGFSYKSKCGPKLKAGADCVIVVNWKPETEGTAQGVLTVRHSGESTMSTLELSATYTPPAEEGEGAVTISPEALDFGSSETPILMSRSVVLNNSSGADITVEDIAIDASEEAGFSYKSKCPAILKDGANCVIVVTWKADAEGTAQGVLTVSHSGEEAMATLELTAAYTPPTEEGEGDVSISPDALDFGSTDTSILMSRSVVLSNNTDEDIKVTDIAIDASDEAGYSYKSKCPATLKAGAECVIVINWEAEIVGAAQGVLTVSHTGENTMSTLELTAAYTPTEGEEGGEVTISPEALDFGTSDTSFLMSRSVILSNDSEEDIKVTDIVIDASNRAGFGYRSKCSGLLKAGADCVIVVSWKPETEGVAQGVLTVNHTGESTISTLELTAIYSPPEGEGEGEIEISPEALDFGTSDTSILMSRSVVLSNKTDQDIQIGKVTIDASKKSGFSYDSKCGSILKAGADCAVVVNWKADAEGSVHGVLIVNHSGETTMSTLELTAAYNPVEGEEGEVAISPDALDFGTSEISFLMSRSVVLTNNTDEDIKVTDIAIDASNEAGFGYKSKCTGLLKSGANCVIVVSWKPETEGTAQGVLTVNHTGEESMATLELTAVYSPPEGEGDGEVVIAPEELDFGTSDTSILMSRSVILSNNTNEDIKVTDISIEASKKSGFSFKSKCPETLKSGANCVIVVNWKGDAEGSAQGVLTIDHTGEDTVSTLELTAAYEPAEDEGGEVSISPDALDFGTSNTTFLMSRSVILSNNSDEDIKISDVAIDASKRAGFSYKSKCPATLKAGANCIIVVNWSPETEGTAQGVLTVDHTGEDTISTLEISATYTPDSEEDGEITISPESLDFGTADRPILMSRSVVLSNNSDKDISIEDVVIDASDEAGFGYKSKCPAILKSGASCVMVLNWKAEAVGPAQGVLTVSHTGEATMSMLELTAEYAPEESEVDSDIVMMPETLDFGSTDMTMAQTRSIVLSNESDKVVELGDISIDASNRSGFSYKSKCPATLPEDGECVIVVTWEPDAEGAAQGVLTVDHSGKELMSTLEISATYNPPTDEGGQVVIAPDALDFGSSSGGITMSRSIVLTNESDDAIEIGSIEIEASDQAGFSYKSKCPIELTAGGECVIVVSWKPDAEGSAQGVLTVNHSGKETMSTLELTASYEPAEDEGQLLVEPDTLDLGTSDGNMPVSKSIVITNESEEAIAIENVEIIAPSIAGFNYNSKCPDVLEAQAKCTIIVAWQPTVEGLAQGVINIAHSGKEQMTSIEISGTYDEVDEEEGSVTLDPDVLDFGTSNGGIPISKSVILTNNTDEDIEIDEVMISAADRSGFEVKSQCPSKLKADGSCVVVVVWTPLSNGLAQGVLTVNHSGKESVASLEVSGTFTPDEVTSAEMYPDASPDKGLLVADKEEIDFGADVDEAASIVISLVNKGNAKLVIHDMSLSGLNNGIYFSKKGCYEGIELMPGSACPLIMNWLPKREGELVDSLQLTHSGARGILVIPLTGTSTGVSEQGLEMEKKATFDKEADVFFEDFFYDKMMEDGVLDDETIFTDKIDLDKVKEEMIDIDVIEEIEDNTVISSHARDRAILIKPDGNSIIVRDGAKVLIERVRWNVSVIPEGVVLSSGDDVITLDFDSSLIPGSSSVTEAVSGISEVPPTGEPETVPPSVEPAAETEMVNPDVEDAIESLIDDAMGG